MPSGRRLYRGEEDGLIAPGSHLKPNLQFRADRTALPFHGVNMRGCASFLPGMQRHHLIPCQVARSRAFQRMVAAIGEKRIGCDDFRRNGLLLPATEAACRRSGMPLHRGPHRIYNDMVASRIALIERDWRKTSPGQAEAAAQAALMRIGLLQGALRRRLLASGRRRMLLSTRDPLGHGLDFTELDAMADQLWADTAEASAPGVVSA